MELRLGDLLVQSGVLDDTQVKVVLDTQKQTGEPFGVLAEKLFKIDPKDIEQAWAKQYAQITRVIDPALEVFDRTALELITRRQAWQFRVLPIRFESPELMIATTEIHLPRALRFAANVICYPVFFVMTSPDQLGAALCEHFPLPGMSIDSVMDDGNDRYVAIARSAA